MSIEGNEIVRNSWDGIALYRDASAVIAGNVIDGVDKARGSRIGGGRGVAIGLTWNAFADVRGNLVKRYWKGIGVFVDAWGCVQENVIEDIVTWGIAYWDADKGKPVGFFEDNVIYGTGACGASITCAETSWRRSSSAGFVRNVRHEDGAGPQVRRPRVLLLPDGARDPRPAQGVRRSPTISSTTTAARRRTCLRTISSGTSSWRRSGRCASASPNPRCWGGRIS